MSFTGKVQALVSWALTAGSGITSAAASSSVSDLLTNFTDGTGDGKASGVYVKSGSISASANDDIDLSGSVTNAFGTTVAMAKIKAIAIKNKATTTGYNLLIGGSASAAITTILGGTAPTLKIGPKGWVVLNNPFDGHVVTATTADILRLTASGGDITYDLAIFYEV
ncbi:MAG: hypothetical protein KF805_12455 [Phycisphaeraceae bacterium]|nr:hypothetical protein [Phycisphaeraceae bacterium]